MQRLAAEGLPPNERRDLRLAQIIVVSRLGERDQARRLYKEVQGAYLNDPVVRSFKEFIERILRLRPREGLRPGPRREGLRNAPR